MASPQGPDCLHVCMHTCMHACLLIMLTGGSFLRAGASAASYSAAAANGQAMSPMCVACFAGRGH